jgi:hypothetical protein
MSTPTAAATNRSALPPPEECKFCHQIKMVATRVDEDGNKAKGVGEAVCYDCSAEPEECALCHNIRPVYKRQGGKKGEGPGICKVCTGNSNKKKCRWCGETRRVSKSVRKDGEPRSAGLPCCQSCDRFKKYLEPPKF